MTESTITITNEEYQTLVGIAIVSRTLTNYYREADTFKFMVDYSVDDLEKKLSHESVKDYVGKELPSKKERTEMSKDVYLKS